MPDTLDSQSPQQKILTPALVGADAFYFTGEDNLQIASMNSAAGVELTIRIRFMNTEGVIIPLVYTHTPNTDRTVKTETYTAGNGWLLNVDIFASSGAPQVGQCFVMFRVIRGLLGNVRELATLCQGLLTSSQRLAWPGAPIQLTTDQPGCIRSITGTNPAAGVEISETVPTGARWRLIALIVTLEADATVATRQPVLTFDDGVKLLANFINTGSRTASANCQFTWAIGSNVATVPSTNFGLQGVPTDARLLAGYRIKTNTINFQAGDDYAAPQLLVEEWIEGL